MRLFVVVSIAAFLSGCASTGDTTEFNRKLTESLNTLNSTPYIQNQRARQYQQLPPPQRPVTCTSRRVYSQIETVCQ